MTEGKLRQSDWGTVAREEVVEWAVRLRHDLGKYISMQQRWLAADATLAERQEALLADILQTRRGEEGSVDAFQIWADYWAFFSGERPLRDGSRVDLSADRDLQEVAHQLRILSTVVEGLVSDPGALSLIEQGEAAARAVSGACRSFSRRIQSDGYGAMDV